MKETTDATFGSIPAGKHAMAVMGLSGDTKVIWDRSVPAEVESARTQFEFFRGKGYTAFRMNANDGRGERMASFDAAAERIVFVPQMQGG